MFNHCPPKQLVELETTDIKGKRHYITPKGKYPSITSVLGAFPNPAIIQWRKRVGEEEANRISKKATSRGTKLHTLCEVHLSNNVFNRKEFMPDVLSSFYDFLPLLNNINNIHSLETPLYSERLKVAGRCDAIAEFNGKLSIIDFKTSKKEKKEEWINDYFLQTAAYHIMYWELTGIKTEQLVILISVDDGKNQVFIKDPKDYIKPLINKVKKYYDLYY